MVVLPSCLALYRSRIIARIDLREKRYVQLPFYTFAIDTLREKDMGIFFIDVDEFLRPEPAGRTVRQIACEWLDDPSIGAVGLNWAIYGSSGRELPGEELVLERFTHRAPIDFANHRHTKIFARARSCLGIGANPHYVKLNSGRYVNTRREDMVWNQTSHSAGIAATVVWDNLKVRPLCSEVTGRIRSEKVARRCRVSDHRERPTAFLLFSVA